jgi:AbrB family transcriptional regulator (stage V sporulation protein T)
MAQEGLYKFLLFTNTTITVSEMAVTQHAKWRNFHMKATGIVRRIDDLGRVVIPKEIRRTLRLREGTPLEIFTDREGEIILKKYSPMMELNAFAAQYAEAMAQSTGFMVCITDRDQVIAAAGGARKELLQKPISSQLEHVIQERMTVQAGKDDKTYTPVAAEDVEGVTAQVVAPIICEGDAIGSVIVMSREPRARFSDAELRLAATAAGFLGRQMES